MTWIFIDLRELQRALDQAAYVDAVWSMRVKDAPPIPDRAARGWKWNRAKIIPFRRAGGRNG